MNGPRLCICDGPPDVAEAIHCGLHAIAESIRSAGGEIGKEGASGMGALEGFPIALGEKIESAAESAAQIIADSISSLRETE